MPLRYLKCPVKWRGTRGVFRGGPRGPPPPPIVIFLAQFKYSLTWFMPNHVYNLCRIA